MPETDDANRFLDLQDVYIGPHPDTATPFVVETVRCQRTKRGITVLLKVEGVDSVEAATRLRNQDIFADERDLPPLEDDEFFIHDLIGLEVRGVTGEALGVVQDVVESPAHYVCVIEQLDGSEALVPLVEAFVKRIDFEEAQLVLQPIEGLLG